MEREDVPTRAASAGAELRARLGALPTVVGVRGLGLLLGVELDPTHDARAVASQLLARGLVPRTFPDGHPLADHLRLTVRAADENDRFIEAARAIAQETPS